MIRHLLRLLALAILLAVVVGMGTIELAKQVAVQPLQNREAELLVVARGSHARAVLKELQRRGVIEANPLTPYLVHLRPEWTRIQAGTYRLYPGEPLGTLWRRLMSGDAAKVSVTLIEGMKVNDVLALLRRTPDLKQTLAPEVTVATLGQQLQPAVVNAEGWLMPDTYLVDLGSSDLALLQHAYTAMRSELEQQWAKRSASLPYSDPYAALIMASIIEKESGHAPERPLIASVFVNRLRVGMRLQTDPTVIYGLGDRYAGNITRDHLRQPTPYNTYTIDGLPPTPIALPSRAALHAALNPAQSDYFYFVSRGNGEHQFSRTLDEHNAAVRRYILGLEK